MWNELTTVPHPFAFLGNVQQFEALITPLAAPGTSQACSVYCTMTTAQNTEITQEIPGSTLGITRIYVLMGHCHTDPNQTCDL